MKEIDHLALDGHALELFLAVLEEGSVTSAATRLGLTQSAVSHALNKLRRIAGDPLFAKSGRGIVATAHAQALAAKARALIDEMRSFAGGVTFTPASAQLSLTIAANDFQRDLLLPRFFGHVAAQVKNLNLRVIPSQSPSPAMLRENRCDLLITPLPPVGIDIVQKRLLSDHYVCYYDPKTRTAPSSRSILAVISRCPSSSRLASAMGDQAATGSYTRRTRTSGLGTLAVGWKFHSTSTQRSVPGS